MFAPIFPLPCRYRDSPFPIWERGLGGEGQLGTHWRSLARNAFSKNRPLDTRSALLGRQFFAPRVARIEWCAPDRYSAILS